MAKFAKGEVVTVNERFPRGAHIRTPFYCRGKTGIVERICGSFHNPEELAFGTYDGPEKILYRVRFMQTHLWPDYAENPGDTIEIEIYEHWLDPASEGEARHTPRSA